MSDSTNQLMDESATPSRKRRLLLSEPSSKYTFSLSPAQAKIFEQWKKQFDHLRTGPVGGIFKFEFTPTSIVTIVKVIMEVGFDANGTKQETILDLTDYDDDI